MARYASGDADAFAELFQRYEPRAFAYFLKRTHSYERAQDLYQETFLRIHRSRRNFDSRRAFAPWFFRIARRLLIDDERRAYRTYEINLQNDEHWSTPNGGDRVESRELVAQLVGSLSEEERETLIAAKAEGVGYAELAARLGKSVDAVKKMVSRTVLRLRAVSAAEPATPCARNAAHAASR